MTTMSPAKATATNCWPSSRPRRTPLSRVGKDHRIFLASATLSAEPETSETTFLANKFSLTDMSPFVLDFSQTQNQTPLFRRAPQRCRDQENRVTNKAEI